MGDTRHGKSPTILYGCLRRYSDIHQSRYLGILGWMSFPFKSVLASKNVTRVFGVLSVRHNKKGVAKWQPLADEFNEANKKSREGLKTRGGKEIKGYFDVPMLKRKFDSMRAKYLQLRTMHKVGRHQLVGEAGAAAEGQANTAQAAIDAATKEVHWLAAFLAAFGEVQCLRNDTWTESISPANPRQCVLILRL
jgi:hypothetical protein